MKARGITLMFLIALLFFLGVGCAEQKYAANKQAENKEIKGSRVTPTGEIIGWEDIRRMPR